MLKLWLSKIPATGGIKILMTEPTVGAHFKIHIWSRTYEQASNQVKVVPQSCASAR